MNTSMPTLSRVWTEFALLFVHEENRAVVRTQPYVHLQEVGRPLRASAVSLGDDALLGVVVKSEDVVVGLPRSLH